MIINNPSMLEQWQQALIIDRWDNPGIGDDFDVPYFVIELDECVREVIRSKAILFPTTKRAISPNSKISSLGKRVLRCMRTDWNLVKKTYPLHSFSPYFELFARLIRTSALSASDLEMATTDKFNDFVDLLRAEAGSAGFKRAMANQRRRVVENSDSMRKYIKALFNTYSKLLVVRVDLRFSPAFRASLGGKQIKVEYVRDRFREFMKHLDRKFPHLVGFARKLEFGSVTSWHYHLLIFFDGQKVREDITLGELIGERWARITDNNGTFWNCNLHADKYARWGLLGVGMIQHGDKEARANLDRVSQYLIKIDDYVSLQLPEGWRAFTHGVPKRKKNERRGRPRTFRDELENFMPPPININKSNNFR